MPNAAANGDLQSLLTAYKDAGGELDYVILEPRDAASPYETHRAAAIAGIAEVDSRLAEWARRHASPRFPMESFFRLRWDVNKLTGKPVTFAEFWGSDDVEPRPLGADVWAIPPIDGYRSAFFHPVHGLSSQVDAKTLFNQINAHVLGSNPKSAEIFSWSTDWSNYFDAGHEWWGAFYWTIRPPDARHIAVIAGSATD